MARDDDRDRVAAAGPPDRARRRADRFRQLAIARGSRRRGFPPSPSRRASRTASRTARAAGRTGSASRRNRRRAAPPPRRAAGCRCRRRDRCRHLPSRSRRWRRLLPRSSNVRPGSGSDRQGIAAPRCRMDRDRDSGGPAGPSRPPTLSRRAPLRARGFGRRRRRGRPAAPISDACRRNCGCRPTIHAPALRDSSGGSRPERRDRRSGTPWS